MLIWPKKWNIIKDKNLLSHIKMSKEISMFKDTEIGENKFYRNNTFIF